MNTVSWSRPTIPVMETGLVLVAFEDDSIELYDHEVPGATVVSQFSPYVAHKIIGWAYATFEFPHHLKKDPAEAGPISSEGVPA